MSASDAALHNITCKVRIYESQESSSIACTTTGRPLCTQHPQMHTHAAHTRTCGQHSNADTNCARTSPSIRGHGHACAGRPFVLLEVRSVSLRLCMRAVGVDDVVRALATVLRRHRVPAANFVGHSFGTFVVAHMRKLFPETVSSVLLCDPVRVMAGCHPCLTVISFARVLSRCYLLPVTRYQTGLRSHT